MKSHFLVDISSEAKANEALCALLPGQERPWLLQSSAGDPVAYFNVGVELDDEPSLHVQADLSGRHAGRDAEVLDIFRRLHTSVGGVITDDA